MTRGLGWFLLGILGGVVGTLAWQQFRERYGAEEDVDDISDSIERKLGEMEAVLN